MQTLEQQAPVEFPVEEPDVANTSNIVEVELKLDLLLYFIYH